MIDVFTLPRRRPQRRIRVSVRVEAWPETDRQRWLAIFVTGDLFDDSGAGAHLAAATRKAREDSYGTWLGFLRRYDPAAIGHLPEDRVTRDRVIRFCAFLAETNSRISVSIRLDFLRQCLRLLAPETDWQWLLTTVKRVRYNARPRPKMHRQQPADKVYALGCSLMDKAHSRLSSSGSISLLEATAYRDGLIIATLALLCPRRRNISSMVIDKHILRSIKGWRIRFAADETKGKLSIELPIPAELIRYFETYLRDVRRMFPRSALHNGLWASQHGRQLTEHGLYLAVCRRTKAAFGTAMNPHLFRDAAATSLAIHVPDQVRAAADLLGHGSLIPTLKHYIHAQGITAARLLAQIIRKREQV